MLPIKMDMTRSECQTYLRCLELDAYGNMVSVLRAQGSFTEDKKCLLNELAKVLRISNERHRAEVRRAVNDEKLSIIAEELSGPNTWTDWAIEGRRTIPLLPRLKPHTAFTGLANSLSFVIAAANEKKVPLEEKNDERILHIAESENEVGANHAVDNEMVLSGKIVAKQTIGQTPSRPRGKKRKRSALEAQDSCRNAKIRTFHVNLNNHSPFDNTKSFEGEKKSLLPTDSLETIETDENSTPNSMDDTAISSSRKCSSSPTTCTITSTSSSQNDSTNSVLCQLPLLSHPKATTPSPPPIADIPQYDLPDDMASEKKIVSSDSPMIVHVNNLTDDSQSSESEELSKLKKDDVETKSLTENSHDKKTNMSISKLESIANSDIETSSGTVSPQIKSPNMILKKVTIEKFNQPLAEMGITLNSNKTVNISSLPNVRLGSKTNVIVVQKGTTRSVKLSPACKDISLQELGKVIMRGKNVCISSKLSPLTLLPHRPNSNNGDQTPEIISPSDSPVVDDTNSKLDEGVAVEIHQEAVGISDEVDLYQAISVDDSDCETFIAQPNEGLSVNDQNEDCLVLLEDDQRDIVDRNDGEAQENEQIVAETDAEEVGKTEKFADVCMEIEETLECSEVPEFEEVSIADEHDTESHSLLDAQTEIYSFESTMDNVCEIETEETVSTTGIEGSSSQVVSTGPNIETFSYTDEDTNAETS